MAGKAQETNWHGTKLCQLKKRHKEQCTYTRGHLFKGGIVQPKVKTTFLVYVFWRFYLFQNFKKDKFSFYPIKIGEEILIFQIYQQAVGKFNFYFKLT